jgi:hypothetical protein
VKCDHNSAIRPLSRMNLTSNSDLLRLLIAIQKISTKVLQSAFFFVLSSLARRDLNSSGCLTARRSSRVRESYIARAVGVHCPRELILLKHLSASVPG